MDALLFNVVNATCLTLLVALELRSQTFRKVLKDWPRMKRNLAFLLTSVAVGVLLHRSVAWLDRRLPDAADPAPLWLQLPALFMLAELLNWGLHWAKHKSAFLWRLHAPHHKEDHYSIWLTVHTYGPEILLSGTVINVVLLVVGFEAFALELYLLFYSLTNAYQHSSLPHSLGRWLDKLIVSPAYHRHHHGGEQLNFGSTLTLWDVIFRTVRFPKDRFEAVNPPSIEETPEPFGFVAEMMHPFAPARSRRPAPRASERWAPEPEPAPGE